MRWQNLYSSAWVNKGTNYQTTLLKKTRLFRQSRKPGEPVMTLLDFLSIEKIKKSTVAMVVYGSVYTTRCAESLEMQKPSKSMKH